MLWFKEQIARMLTKRREEEWGIYGCDLDLDAVEAVVDPNEPPLRLDHD